MKFYYKTPQLSIVLEAMGIRAALDHSNPLCVKTIPNKKHHPVGGVFV